MLEHLRTSGLAPRLSAALDTSSFRALKVAGGDPALVVSLGATGNGRAIGADDADLLRGVDLLGALRRALCALTALATALLLGEESGDPGVVDEVAGTSKGTSKDKVEEDAWSRC